MSSKSGHRICKVSINMSLALDSYILLNVIYCFPEMWNSPSPRQNDYRQALSYQSLVWRNTFHEPSGVASYPHRHFLASGTTSFMMPLRFR